MEVHAGKCKGNLWRNLPTLIRTPAQNWERKTDKKIRIAMPASRVKPEKVPSLYRVFRTIFSSSTPLLQYDSPGLCIYHASDCLVLLCRYISLSMLCPLQKGLHLCSVVKRVFSPAGVNKRCKDSLHWRICNIAIIGNSPFLASLNGDGDSPLMMPLDKGWGSFPP